MIHRNRIAATLGLAFFLFSAEAAENAEKSDSGGCEASHNRETWFLKYRECGSTSSQASLLANISETPVEGGQYSFIANIATDKVSKTQWSGGINYAKHARAQVAYNMNIARTVDRFQFGGFNLADSVGGSQLGFVNVARKLDGYGIGFLTLAGNGLLHLDALTEETGMGSLSFSSGKGFFTSYSFGFTPDEENHPYSLGMGFGYNQALGRSYLEGELRAHLVVDELTRTKDIENERKHVGDSDWRHNTLLQAKIRTGARLFGSLGVFGGLSYNALVTHGNDRLMAPWSDELTSTSKEVFCWPGVEIGIRFGR